LGEDGAARGYGASLALGKREGRRWMVEGAGASAALIKEHARVRFQIIETRENKVIIMY